LELGKRNKRAKKDINRVTKIVENDRKTRKRTNQEIGKETRRI
jgi:hypothetical protein